METIGLDSLPAGTRPVTARRRITIALLILWAATLTVYANSLQGPFVFDDLHNIEHNPYLRLTTLGASNLHQAMWHGPSQNRPVAKLSFAINYYFHGLSVGGFHLVNVIIHGMNSALVFWLTILLLDRSKTSLHGTVTGTTESANPHQRTILWTVPLAAAMLFAVHPLQTQAVTYTVQRMASLATLFYLMAFISYIHGRRAKYRRRLIWWTGTALCWLLALGTKENSVMLPITIGLYEYCFYHHSHRYFMGRRVQFAICGSVGSLLVGMLFLCIYLQTASPIDALIQGYGFRDFDMWQRVLTQFRVVTFYTTLVLFPAPERLNLTHWIQTSSDWLSPPSTTLAATVLACIMAAAIYHVRRFPTMAFGILFVFVNLIVESSVINLEMVFEHRMYLPMVGVAVAVAGLAHSLVNQPRTFTYIAVPLLLVCGLWTLERNRIWQDAITLWTDVINKNAHDARPMYNRGHAHQKANNLNRAEQDYLEAIHREFYLEAYTNLANLYAVQERHDESIRLLNQAIAAHPQTGILYSNRGSIHLKQGNQQAAARDFETALAWDPDCATAYYNRGRLAAEKGKTDEVLADYTVAIEKDPFFFEAYVNRANTHFRQNRFSEALLDYDQAITLKPQHPSATYFRALCLLRLRHYRQALTGFTRTINIYPNYVDAHDHLAWVMATSPDSSVRNGEKAIHAAKTACRLSQGTNFRHRATLAAAFAENGQFDDAVREQKASIQLAPNDKKSLLRRRLQMYRNEEPYHESP